MSYRFVLILCLLCSVLSALISACTLSRLPISDALTTAMGRYAGADSINCGVVPVGGAPEAANRCVDAAYQAKKAFTVRYNLQGIDALIAEGLASNGQGEVHVYFYDSDPSGGSHTGEQVTESQCRTIKPVLDVSGKRRGCEP